MLDSTPTLSDILRASANAWPENSAIVDHQGQLTYRELDQQVDALASFLARHDVNVGDTVAFLLWNQREFFFAYHGITRIGAVTVSLNYRLTAAEIAHQLSASGARFIIYDESFLEVVDEALAIAGESIGRIQVGEASPPPPAFAMSRVLAEPASIPLLEERAPTPEQISGIWFTSGTEGKPKGAAVRHRSAIAAALASTVSIGMHSNSRCLAVAPLFHRGAAECIALAVTMVGGTHYLQPRFNPANTLKALREQRITMAFIVPTMARMLIQELNGSDYELPDMDSWVTASAPMPLGLEAEIRARFKLTGIISYYGITEMVAVAARRMTPDRPYDGSVGCPLPMMQVLIHDEARGVLPPGEVGEIIIRGPAAFSHYINNPAATEAATIRVNGVEWYRSGDIGQICSDGALKILDRRKDMIICGGENIYSAEVEGAIALHPKVAEVCVVGRCDDQWGEIVVAFVVLREHAVRPTLDEIRAACCGLASYKQPKEVFFLPAFPRNSFGKVQKPKLKTMATTITQESIDVEHSPAV